ncbi:MAG: energy-coupling factor transporter transmembrane component T [Oscillospiraceae bacterium]
MLPFSDYNPLAVTIWFLCTILTAMFSGHPVFVFISLTGSVLYFLILNGRNHGKTHGFFFMLFLLFSLVNPLVSHNGKTVLFVFNNNPITLEALLYGVNASAAIIGALYWFRAYSALITSDKLFYITAFFSDKISLVLSMTLRFAELFRKQFRKSLDSQRATGLFNDDNIIDSIRGYTRIFSILVTWALENGITTADSMEARGFGCGKRTQMKTFRFRKCDIFLIILSLICFSLTVFSVYSMNFNFYPEINFSKINSAQILGITAYVLLALTPSFIETEAQIKWKYLVSKN